MRVYQFRHSGMLSNVVTSKYAGEREGLACEAVQFFCVQRAFAFDSLTFVTPVGFEPTTRW